MKKIILILLCLVLFLQFNVGEKKDLNKNIKRLEKLEKFIEVNNTNKVKDAFDKFIKENSIPTSTENLKDGDYSGDSIYDNYKYKHSVKLTIKNGKLVKVFYNEIKKDGKDKRNNKIYCSDMKKGSGVSPAEAYPIYEKKLLKHQDFMKVDAVSGATYSLYRFRTALIRAFLKAKK